MRVTNSMISNSSRSHIENAKYEMMLRENQYTTQKKILRPSDDPTIAIRSLQLRTTYAQIDQYVEKNVQDGMKWMNATETAIKNINEILIHMKERLNQGANDYLGVDERHSVLSTLKEYAAAVFEDEANTDFAGRYVFTGYRTDTSLIFPDEVKNLEYEIKQNFASTDIDTIKYVYDGANYAAGTTAAQYAAQVPKQDTAYHLKLAYDNCSDSAITGSTNPAISITLDGDAYATPKSLSIRTMSSADVTNYKTDIAGNDAIYLYDTGEIIFSDAIFSEIQQNAADMQITYSKKEFDKSDIRPEMYFECTSYNTDSKKTTPYRDPSGQAIEYEINFSQTSKVNTQAKDAIDTDIYRAIDYLEQTILAMDEIEKKISDVDTMIANTTNEADIATYKKLKEVLEQEQKLRVGCMTEAFGKGLTMVDKTQAQLNVALAELGSRYNRFELTFDKLSDQRIDTEQKLSDNEDVDLADAFINLTQADNLYQAALTATSKILGNSLLNYI